MTINAQPQTFRHPETNQLVTSIDDVILSHGELVEPSKDESHPEPARAEQSRSIEGSEVLPTPSVGTQHAVSDVQAFNTAKSKESTHVK